MSGHTVLMAPDELLDGQQQWADMVLKSNELFQTDYCGYWLRGVQHNAAGWLVWEDDEQHAYGQEPNRSAAEKAWLAGAKLPQGWYKLDAGFVQQAWLIGVRLAGEWWFEEGDSIVYDTVMQLTLLGEVRYS